jgi:DNA-binding IscR family transcriptional regulator
MKQFSVERASDNLTFPGDMSDSQKFPVAAHALAYLAHKEAFSADRAVASAELAASVPTNPVVVRRVTALVGLGGVLGARAGANGGAWLLKPADSITLDVVLKAVNGCAHLGVAPKGVKGCPVGEKIPDAVRAAIGAADRAAHERLAQITVADLLNGAHQSAAVA